MHRKSGKQEAKEGGEGGGHMDWLEAWVLPMHHAEAAAAADRFLLQDITPKFLQCTLRLTKVSSSYICRLFNYKDANHQSALG